MGFLGLALEVLQENPQARSFLQIAMDELETSASIVGQLRDLVRPSRDKEKKLTDMQSLIEKSLLVTSNRCSDKNIEVKWERVPDLPSVFMVGDYIQQVLINLILNAIEAMDRGGILQLRAAYLPGEAAEATGEEPLNPEDRCTGGELGVSVADNGCGIDEARKKILFEPFQTSKSDGMGLGLYICNKIIDSHGGRFEVTSHPGEGSVFTFWLPC